MINLLTKRKNSLEAPDKHFFEFSSRITAQFSSASRFLTSFPRSGNTWMRRLLASALGYSADELVPDLHNPTLKIVPPQQPVGQAILYKSHTVFGLDKYRHIYLFRLPEDALVSYAHFSGRATAGCDRFVRRSLRTYAYQLSSVYEQALSHPERWLLLSYESLIQDTERSIFSAIHWLGLQVSKDSVGQAITAGERRQAYDQGKGHYVARSVGKGKTEISGATLKLVKENSQAIYDALRYLEIQQNS